MEERYVRIDPGATRPTASARGRSSSPTGSGTSSTCAAPPSRSSNGLPSCPARPRGSASSTATACSTSTSARPRGRSASPTASVRRAAVHATALGKAIAAHLSEAERQRAGDRARSRGLHRPAPSSRPAISTSSSTSSRRAATPSPSASGTRTSARSPRPSSTTGYARSAPSASSARASAFRAETLHALGTRGHRGGAPHLGQHRRHRDVDRDQPAPASAWCATTCAAPSPARTSSARARSGRLPRAGCTGSTSSPPASSPAIRRPASAASARMPELIGVAIPKRSRRLHLRDRERDQGARLAEGEVDPVRRPRAATGPATASTTASATPRPALGGSLAINTDAGQGRALALRSGRLGHADGRPASTSPTASAGAPTTAASTSPTAASAYHLRSTISTSTAGTIANRRHLRRASPGEGMPDGLTVDAEGLRLERASGTAGASRRYAPDGRARPHHRPAGAAADQLRLRRAGPLDAVRHLRPHPPLGQAARRGAALGQRARHRHRRPRPARTALRG